MTTGFLIKSNDVRNERAQVGAIYSTYNIDEEKKKSISNKLYYNLLE
jgi:hypothetical protein